MHFLYPHYSRIVQALVIMLVFSLPHFTRATPIVLHAEQPIPHLTSSRQKGQPQQIHEVITDVVASVTSNITTVAITDTIAYVATPRDRTIGVIDAHNPKGLSRRIGITLPAAADPASDNTIAALDIIGTRLYITQPDVGLHVVDITMPYTPTLLGTFAPPAVKLVATEIVGNRLYALTTSTTTSQSQLLIVDLSNPNIPSILESMALVGAEHLRVVGTRVYTLNNAGTGCSMVIIDVQNPTNPIIQSTLLTPCMSDIDVLDTTAYLAGGDVLQVDVSDPQSPQLVSNDNLHYPAESIQIVGTRAYLRDSCRFNILDLSDAANPVEIGAYNANKSGGGGSLAITTDRVYLPCSGTSYGGGVLDVVQINPPNSPQLLGRFEAPHDARNVRISDNRAYVIDTESLNLWIYDIANPAIPQQLGRYFVPGIRDVWIVDHLAYVAMRDGLEIIDVEDPSQPLHISSYFTPSPNVVQVVSNTTYIGTEQQLLIIDVSIPSKPVLRGLYNTPVSDLHIADQRGFLIGYEGLTILDVSEPTLPTYIGGLTNIAGQGLDVVGEIVYVVSGGTDPFTGLYSVLITRVDIHNATAPVMLGSYRTLLERGDEHSRKDIYVMNQVGYVFSGTPTATILDVGDPARMMRRGSYTVPSNSIFQGIPQGGQVIGNLLFVAAGHGGFQILNVRIETCSCTTQFLPILTR